MELYRILVRSKDDKSWFFVMNIYESFEEAESFAKGYPEGTNWRVIMQEVVMYD